MLIRAINSRQFLLLDAFDSTNISKLCIGQLFRDRLLTRFRTYLEAYD